MELNGNQTATDVNQTKPIRCIVKLGGAAITCKNELEKINEENLEIVSTQLRQALLSSDKVVGMDWSKRPGISDIACNVAGFRDKLRVDSTNFIVVHGGGSFGHFQASNSGVHKGGLQQPLVKAGFVATRISVTTLNLEIVRALAREGIPSVGMSPFSCGWSTSGGNLPVADLSVVAKTIKSGFVPVLHGDAVLDDVQGCTILSGDVIMRHLAAYMKPDYVVFLVSSVNDEFHSMHLYLGRSFMDCTQQCFEFVYAPSDLDDSHIVKLFNHCVCFCVINNSCRLKSTDLPI